MNLFTGIAAAGVFVRDSAERAAGAVVSGIERGISNTSATATKQAENSVGTALGNVAARVADNAQIQGALNKLGTIASAPTSKLLEPKIIAASVAAIVAIAVIVYLARKH